MILPAPNENHDLRHCFACGEENRRGMHLQFALEPGIATAEIDVDESYVSWKGVIHGGLLATMMDEAIGWSVASLGRTALTARLEVRYLEPVSPPQHLIIRAEVVERDQRMARTTAVVELPDGRPVARAKAVMIYADTLPHAVNRPTD